MQRCFNPRHPKYKDYGGRGITVCEKWRSFEGYFADTGLRPEGRTLDRIDVNGNYEPGNVQWATPKQQRQNQRRWERDRTSREYWKAMAARKSKPREPTEIGS